MLYIKQEFHRISKSISARNEKDQKHLFRMKTWKNVFKFHPIFQRLFVFKKRVKDRFIICNYII